MKINEIVRITRGKLESGDCSQKIIPSKISTDSRTIEPGGLFIALTGPNFDGNSFVDSAFKKGAIGAIVTKYDVQSTKYKKIVIRVKDTTKALQAIAAYHRSRFKIPVIAVTGSNGKTTVKDMIWSILSTKYDALRNEGTNNNHIGVPQTLLRLKKRHDICVLEMGANHKGEIKALGAIAHPTVAVITNIGPSHLEFFVDLEGVCKAKKEILSSLDKKGLVVINGDDRYLAGIKKGVERVIKFGLQRSNDFYADMIRSENNKLRFRVNGKEDFELNLMGAHNVYNALCAIAVCRQFGISYPETRSALKSCKPTSMRMNLKHIRGITVINDSYNSNPLSMAAALDVIKEYGACSKWVVAGDMMELGPRSIYFHEDIGNLIANAGARGLLTMGPLSKYTLRKAYGSGMDKDRLWHCKSHEEAARILARVAKKGDVVLLKGSRSMKMEKVLEKLKG